MAQHEPLEFDDLTLVEIPVSVGGRPYILREANGAAAKKLTSARAASIVMQDGKVAGMRNAGEIEPMFVSQCLFYAEGGAQDGGQVHAKHAVGKLVPQSIVEKWPGKVVRALFNKAVEISDLDEKRPDERLLYRALQHEDSPVTLETFTEYVNGLGEGYKALQDVLKPSAEELAKNGQSDTTAGYD